MQFMATASQIQTHTASAAPAAIGPYSHATSLGDLVFCSGQIPLDPAHGRLVGDAVDEQTRQVLANLKAVLEAAGSGLDHVLKATVFLTDMGDFPIVNALYAEAFGDHRPARSTIQVAALPAQAKVEIEAIAARAN